MKPTKKKVETSQADAYLRDALGPTQFAVFSAFRRQANRERGKLGGRPSPKTRTPDLEILLRFGEHWLTTGDSGRARRRITKEIAAECEVDEKTARSWVTQAVGPGKPAIPPQKKKRE
jgi:hypothetical protein